MLIIGIILFGMIAGGLAQIILGQRPTGVDWTLAFVSGLVGSFVGGLLISLLAGDGLALRPSGLLGSIVGAVIVTVAYQWWNNRRTTKAA